jgi:hypothetical protein
LCGNEIEKKDEFKFKTKNLKGLENDKIYYVCRNCVVEFVLKPAGFKDFDDYIQRYWGIKNGKVE